MARVEGVQAEDEDEGVSVQNEQLQDDVLQEEAQEDSMQQASWGSYRQWLSTGLHSAFQAAEQVGSPVILCWLMLVMSGTCKDSRHACVHTHVRILLTTHLQR